MVLCKMSTSNSLVLAPNCDTFNIYRWNSPTIHAGTSAVKLVGPEQDLECHHPILETLIWVLSSSAGNTKMRVL